MTGPPEEALSGRVALVTGGTRGIGAAICGDLARRGVAAAAGFSSNRERADAFSVRCPRARALTRATWATPRPVRAS